MGDEDTLLFRCKFPTIPFISIGVIIKPGGMLLVNGGFQQLGIPSIHWLPNVGSIGQPIPDDARGCFGNLFLKIITHLSGKVVAK